MRIFVFKLCFLDGLALRRVETIPSTGPKQFKQPSQILIVRLGQYVDSAVPASRSPGVAVATHPTMADVLIVEDLGLQRAVLRGFLSTTHTVVGEATTEREAVRLARHHAPDVVVMDLNLERGNGVEATAVIKTLDPSIAIVVSTVTVTESVREQAMEAGADAYLSKPYGKADLLEAIESTLG
jgi:two-component system chemotaxis response regulator CheY